MSTVGYIARKLAKSAFGHLGLKVQRLSPTQIRGVDPVADMQFLLRDVESPTIFDVGANDGETAAEFLECFPAARLVAFEPFTECCDQLRKRFAGHANVRVENAALGDSSGEAQLNLYSGNRMNSLLELNDSSENIMKGFQKTGATKTRIETLDRFCAAEGIRRIDSLKIDTQGYDFRVLKGASDLLAERRIKTILLEINFIPMYRDQLNFSALHDFLFSRGYRIVDFYNHVWKNDHTAWCDALYIAP